MPPHLRPLTTPLPGAQTGPSVSPVEEIPRASPPSKTVPYAQVGVPSASEVPSPCILTPVPSLISPVAVDCPQSPSEASIPDSQTPPSSATHSRVRNLARQIRFTSVHSGLAELKVHSQPTLASKRSSPASPTASLPLDSDLEPLSDRMLQCSKKFKATFVPDSEDPVGPVGPEEVTLLL
jgi:hypothetical protein